MSTKRAVFVDKDGTLVADVPYNVDPARTRLAAGASEGVAALSNAGYEVFVVSNQPGVALGFFDEAQLDRNRTHLEALLDGTLSGFYYCPHHPEAGCRCRKPSPGLLLRAAREHGGNETEWQLSATRRPDCIVADLSQAAAMILAE
jgi:histidinol-phosphate phosphatase family protein